ncbi:MAG: penicillin-binding protein 2, partial [Candidatus Cloacimonetes bacterium]|nr:penicillin-binding protein 2 [Candidatus Cloacimonadota bacterium]
MDNRIKIFLFLNALLFIVWVMYLFRVQLLDPHDFSGIVNLRRNPSKKLITPLRGEIFDRNLEILVSSEKYYQIDLDKSSLEAEIEKRGKESREELYNLIIGILNQYTGLSTRYLREKLGDRQQYPGVYISESINETAMINIKREFTKNKIPGLIVTFSKLRRTYPQGNLAASLLGLVKERGDQEGIYNIHGVCGIEASFDEELTGTFGWQETILDAKNDRIPLMYLKDKSAQNGLSLILTLDNDLQEILEINLHKGLKNFKSAKALGIIMDPWTGEILAMSGMEDDYDKQGISGLLAKSNLPVSFMFEPGSTLKPVTALLALENKVYKSGEKIDCRDYKIKFNNETRIIKDAHEFNQLNLRDILAYSSNVGISRTVEKIGSKVLYERMIELGLGHKTGSELAGEASGILRKLKDWQGFSLHSISFGQEIALTALQLANIYCTFANGGNVMQPFIVKAMINDKREIIQQFRPEVLRKVSNRRSLDTLKTYLKSVIDYGTASGAKFDDLDIAGKTGTAEKIICGESSYSREKFTSIFAGFFPVDEPQYVLVVVIDEPNFKFHFASSSAVPVFHDIVRDIISQP